MFETTVLYEDNHLLVVNKRPGELVQPDPAGTEAIEDRAKAYLKVRYNKAGNVFLGVVHRIDRPVGGVVLLAKTSKALVRLNEQLKERLFEKIYWAITERSPEQAGLPAEGTLRHHLVHNGKTNRSTAHDHPVADSKEALLEYRTLASSDRYHLLEVKLLTGRHHQIRCQLAKIGCPIKGDLKYGAARSNPDGSISLWARSLCFEHPVSREKICVTAPTPADDKLWSYFEGAVNSKA